MTIAGILGEQSYDILAEEQLIADAPVKVRDNILQEYSELDHIGLIIACRLPAGLNDDGMGVTCGQLCRRKHPNQHEAHTGNDQKDDHHVDNSLETVF